MYSLSIAPVPIPASSAEKDFCLLYYDYYLYCVNYFLCFSQVSPTIPTTIKCMSVVWYPLRVAATTYFVYSHHQQQLDEIIIIVYSAIAKQWEQITGTPFTIILLDEKSKIYRSSSSHTKNPICLYFIISRFHFSWFFSNTAEYPMYLMKVHRWLVTCTWVVNIYVEENKIQCAPLSSHLINNFNGGEIFWSHHRSAEPTKQSRWKRSYFNYVFFLYFLCIVVVVVSVFSILCNFLTILCVLGCERGKISLTILCKMKLRLSMVFVSIGAA